MDGIVLQLSTTGQNGLTMSGARGARQPVHRQAISMGFAIIVSLSANVVEQSTDYMRRIATSLNIKAGEERLILRLALANAFLGGTLLFTFNAVNAIFLATFAVDRFPFVFLISAAVTILGNRILAAISQRYSTKSYAIFTFSTASIAAITLYLLLAGTASELVRFIGPIWYGFVEVSLLITFWGIAGRALTVRQSKRLSGVIIAAEVLASIICGLLMAVLVPIIGTSSMLLLAAVTTGCAVLFLLPVIRDLRVETVSKIATPEVDDARSAFAIRNYMVLIVITFMLAVATRYLLNYLLFDQASQRYLDADSLGAFFGLFAAVYDTFNLLVVTFLSGRLLNSRGVRFGLTVTPAVLVGLILIAILAALLPSLTPLLFWTVLAAKATDWILRNAFHFPAVRVLFAPLPAATRLASQVSVEGLGAPLGIGLSSLLLIVLTFWLALPIWVLLSVTGAIVALWVVMAQVLYPQYLAKLRLAIQGKRLPDVALLVSRDEPTLSLLRENLGSSSPQVVLYALNQLRQLDTAYIPIALAELLNHPAPGIRRIAIAQLAQHKHDVASTTVERLLLDPDRVIRHFAARLKGQTSTSVPEDLMATEDEAVRDGALTGLLRHANHGLRAEGRTRLAAIMTLGQDARLAAVAILQAVGLTENNALLAALLQDEATEVRKQALLAAGQIGGESIWPLVVEQLEDVETGRSAQKALTIGGAAAFFYLQDELNRQTIPPFKLRQMAEICRQNRSFDNARLLSRHIATPHLETRLVVLQALQAGGYRLEKGGDTTPFADLLSSAAWLSHSCRAMSQVRGLEHVIAAARANINLLVAEGYAQLSLYPGAPNEADIKQQLATGGREQKAYVRELLGTTLGDQIGSTLMGLLDQAGAAELLHHHFPDTAQTIEARLLQILQSKRTHLTAWLQAATIHALALPAKPLATAQLLETAIQITPSIAHELGLHEGRFAMFSQIEQIIALKATPFFANTAESALARIAGVLAEQHLPQGSVLFEQGEAGNCMYIIVSGKLDIRTGNRSIVVYGPGDVVGELAVIDAQPRSASGIALTDCELLRLDGDRFRQVVEIYPEVARQVMVELSGRLRHTANELQSALDV